MLHIDFDVRLLYQVVIFKFLLNSLFHPKWVVNLLIYPYNRNTIVIKYTSDMFYPNKNRWTISPFLFKVIMVTRLKTFKKSITYFSLHFFLHLFILILIQLAHFSFTKMNYQNVWAPICIVSSFLARYISSTCWNQNICIPEHKVILFRTGRPIVDASIFSVIRDHSRQNDNLLRDEDFENNIYI